MLSEVDDEIQWYIHLMGYELAEVGAAQCSTLIHQLEESLCRGENMACYWYIQSGITKLHVYRVYLPAKEAFLEKVRLVNNKN